MIDCHHERATIEENTSFEWNGLFTQRVKRILAWELPKLRSLVDRNQWLTLCVLQWLAQLAFSEKDDDSILHTHQHC